MNFLLWVFLDLTNLHTSQQAKNRVCISGCITQEFKMLFVKFDRDNKSLIQGLLGQMAEETQVVCHSFTKVCQNVAVDKTQLNRKRLL